MQKLQHITIGAANITIITNIINITIIVQLILQISQLAQQAGPMVIFPAIFTTISFV